MQDAARTPTRILASVEAGVRQRRAAELQEMHDVLDWCAVNTTDPKSEPDYVFGIGSDQLVQYGGEGTPMVSELCCEELAVALEKGFIATHNQMADVLDLAHRLPLTFAETPNLACDLWVLRKVARMSRRLTKKQAGIVDRAVSQALHESPQRIIALAEAKVIEADVAAHEERIRENESRRGVWLSRSLTGDQVEHDERPGVRGVFARLTEGEALAVDQTLDEVADALAELRDGDDRTRDQLRADALVLLADPHQAVGLLDGGLDTLADARGSTTRRQGTIYVHLHEHVLDGTVDGVVRAEKLGALLLSQLRDILGADAQIKLTPVIDLHHGRSVTAYEHPDDVRRRTTLRMSGDVRPHGTSPPGTKIEHDHPIPFDKTGPPGQTGDHNDAPLTKRTHRAKTHLNFAAVQTGPTQYVWRTPHGLARLVTPRGTFKLSPMEADIYQSMHRTVVSRDFGVTHPPGRPARPGRGPDPRRAAGHPATPRAGGG